MKPLLAATVKEISSLNFPLMASPKFDGIRCISKNGGLTKSLKPIPNKYIVEKLLTNEITNSVCLDGELISGDGFQSSTSAIMTQEIECDFVYYVFDIVEEGVFKDRYKHLRHLSESFPSWIKIVHHKIVNNIKELEEFEKECIDNGFEGIMLRNMDKEYKFGRSTLKEEILMKFKRFSDSEATIIGVTPLYKNENIAKKNTLGYSERSTKKEGKVALCMLGSFTVEWKGKQFNVGSGMSLKQRDMFWKQKEELIGKKIKFKYQKSGIDLKTGVPRFPIFLGIRSELDM